MLVSKPVLTQHARIIEDIRRNILNGDWQPGHQLPKETDLADSYGVSRMTMNKVMTQLSREGYVVRRKRSGTVVAQRRAQSAVMEITDIAQEVAARGLRYEWRLFGAQRRVLNDSEAILLDLEDGAKGRNLLFISGLHLAEGEPFCMEIRAIDPAVVPAVLNEDFTMTVPGQWLLKSMPFSAAAHRIRAVSCSGRDAKHLELPLGSPCLEVLRKTKLDRNWVTHVRLLYPGEAHQLLAEFTPRMTPRMTPPNRQETPAGDA
jgi:GntR family histidine utilization transcriptional repressor